LVIDDRAAVTQPTQSPKAWLTQVQVGAFFRGRLEPFRLTNRFFLSADLRCFSKPRRADLFLNISDEIWMTLNVTYCNLLQHSGNSDLINFGGLLKLDFDQKADSRLSATRGGPSQSRRSDKGAGKNRFSETVYIFWINDT